MTASVSAYAPQSLSPDDLARADAAVREAFAFLYRLPSDTAGAAMGSWVVDSAATTSPSEPSGRWRLVVTKLIDTGEGLKVNEMVGEPGTSPAQLAAAMAAMQRLEGKISKAEAEATIELVIALNSSDDPVGDGSPDAQRTKPSIASAQRALLVKGHWTKVLDPEVAVEREQWNPATLVVVFGAREPRRPGLHSVTVTARGNTEMVDRVVKETRWAALSGLIK